MELEKQLKICSSCTTTDAKRWYGPICIKCYNKLPHRVEHAKSTKRIEQRRKAQATWFSKNHEEAIAANKKWAKENKEHLREYSKKPEVKKRASLSYKARLVIDPERKVKIAASNKKHFDKKMKTDLYFKLAKQLRTRMYMAIRNEYKAGSAVRDLGCSIEKLKMHLEIKFHVNHETGEQMTWDNHTQFGWHIDHIIPLASFDLTDREQLLKACHYTNLQPLWWRANLVKGDKLEY